MNPNSIIGTILFVPFTILYLLYLKLSYDEIMVIIKNYNFKRAKFCNPESCGFYYHNENDPQSKDCLNPLISKKFFEGLSQNGNQPGCKRSFQVREVDIERKPASDYKTEFLEVYNTFHASKLWWKFLLILITSIFYVLGILTSGSVLKLLFK